MPLTQLQVGTGTPTARGGVLNETMVTELRGRYADQAARGNTFTLTLAATTTGVAAGNIAAATAGASLNFGLINPLNTGKNLELLKFGMGVISGTPGAGPMFHGYIPNASSITAALPGGTIRSNLLGSGASSVASAWASAASAPLTGGSAVVTHRIADFASTGTAQASVGELKAVEYIDGDLVVPPGAMWVPLWGAAGTSLLNGYSVTWQEVAIPQTGS